MRKTASIPPAVTDEASPDYIPAAEEDKAS